MLFIYNTLHFLCGRLWGLFRDLPAQRAPYSGFRLPGISSVLTDILQKKFAVMMASISYFLQHTSVAISYEMARVISHLNTTSLVLVFNSKSGKY